jgi:putative hemolysin
MYPDLTTFILIILTLIIISGIFTLFGSALSLCKKNRLEKERKKSYKAVLKIIEKPNNLLSACHLWSNILRIFAVFYAGITSLVLFNINPEGFIIFLVVYILLLTLIITLFCDALPRLLSRIKPEKTTSFLLPVMKILSVPMMPFTIPVLKFASFFKNVFKTEIDDNITEDELRDALIEGEKSGIVESKERTMVEGVFYLGDRPVGAFMTHRSEIQLVDINDSYEEIRAKVIEHKYQQCFPVVNGSPDDIAGAVYLEDIILDYALHVPQGLRSIMKKAQFVPETMSALKAFESFKQGQSNFLFVMDEYGGLAGILHIRALVEEIVGELSAPVANEEPIIRQEDGSWLADGTLNIDDAVKALSLDKLDEESDFHTLAGLILHLAGELPRIGDSFDFQGYKFKVIDKDGNRIDKLLITKQN